MGDHSPQGCHIPIVLFEGGGKAVVAISVADEVVKLGLRGIHGGEQGTLPWIGYWARWQARMEISVVRGIQWLGVMMQSAAVSSTKQLCINDRGIGLQGNVARQPVHINAGHLWP